MRDISQHPWAEGNLVIARKVLDRVDDEARRAYASDEESCGLLTGPSGDARLVDGIVPMVNRANALHRLDPEAYPRTGRTYFDIDSMKFESALARGRADGHPVKVLYTPTSTPAHTSRRPTQRLPGWVKTSLLGTWRIW